MVEIVFDSFVVMNVFFLSKKSKRSEAQSTFGKFGGELRKQAEEAWEGVFKKLEIRKALLDQSVSFHTSTQQVTMFQYCFLFT